MDWKKKSAAAIVATGLVGVTEAQAQFGTNLVQNPSFETVTGVSGYSATVNAAWTGSLAAYAYAGNYTQAGPTGSGSWYWHGGSIPAAAGVLSTTQTINLLTSGFSAAQLDAGPNYNFSSFFSGYLGQTDYADAQVTFLDALSATLGSSSLIGGAAFTAALPGHSTSSLNAWGQDSTNGVIPVGTRFVRIDITGHKPDVAGSAVDGYVDLVNFQITPVPEPGTFALLGTVGVGSLLVRWRRRKTQAPTQ